jgi:hypothetical protein
MSPSAGIFVAGKRKLGVSIHSGKELLLSIRNRLLSEIADFWLYVVPCSLAIMYSNMFNKEACVKTTYTIRTAFLWVLIRLIVILGYYAENSGNVFIIILPLVSA